MPIPVFTSERDAGLEPLINCKTSAAAYARVRLTPDDVPSRNLSGLRNLPPGRALGSRDDIDLHYLEAILASVGWNLNDDVFDRLECWTARRTPVDKQLNDGHDDSKIVGHIVNSRVVGLDGTLISEASPVDDLPAEFHVATGAVVYKQWQTAELQARVDELLEDVAQGKVFVSMECLFSGFDYALKDKKGVRIVARNNQTAFMTKHLRAYGGSGQFGGERIGRVLRNLIFSGKALVKTPANPASIILDTPPQQKKTTEAAIAEWFSSQGREQRLVVPTSKLEQDVLTYLSDRFAPIRC